MFWGEIAYFTGLFITDNNKKNNNKNNFLLLLFCFCVIAFVFVLICIFLLFNFVVVVVIYHENKPTTTTKRTRMKWKTKTQDIMFFWFKKKINEMNFLCYLFLISNNYNRTYDLQKMMNERKYFLEWEWDEGLRVTNKYIYWYQQKQQKVFYLFFIRFNFILFSKQKPVCKDFRKHTRHTISHVRPPQISFWKKPHTREWESKWESKRESARVHFNHLHTRDL